MPKEVDFLQQWKKDERAQFEGWDFSYIKGRYSEGKPNWNYISLAKRLIKKTNSVLDVATGGGEVFSKILRSRKPKKVVAIEGYKPNVSVAKKKLRQFRAEVLYAHETQKLPFADQEFDLILNRHGGITADSVKEIHRFLSSQGIFLTQQVDARNLNDLMKEFGAKPKWTFNTLINVKKQLNNAGFEILEVKDWKGKIIFKDVGAIVYFLKAAPWIVDDFSVNKRITILNKLQRKLEKKGELAFTLRKFLILARKK